MGGKVLNVAWWARGQPHPTKGKRLSEEAKHNMSEAWKGRIPKKRVPRVDKICLWCGNSFPVLVTHSEKRKYCSLPCGRVGGSSAYWRGRKRGKTWNKGLTAQGDERVKNYGLRNRGKVLSEETRLKLSQAAKARLANPENHPCWEGGKSYEPYGLDFNDEVKRQVLIRDRFTCRGCGCSHKELPYPLDVHHMDGGKENHTPENLQSLCRSCHTRLHWKMRTYANRNRR